MDDALVFIAKNKTVHKHLKIQATKKNPKNHLLHDMIEEVKIIPDAEENLWIHAGQTFSLTSVHFSIWMIVRVRCSMKARIHLALHQQFKLLVVWWSGGYFIGTLGINWASFKHPCLPEYSYWPCPTIYDYSAPFSDGCFQQFNTPCHKPQIILNWFLEHNN